MTEMVVYVLRSACVSGLVAVILVPLARYSALKMHCLDIPDGSIKNHKQATPYLGGIAVYGGFLISFLLSVVLTQQLCLMLGGLTILLCVGLLDDLVVLKPHQKIVGQIIAAFFFVGAGLHLNDPWLHTYWNYGISLLWMVSVINAFNLVDIMDGLATSLAIVATCSFLMIALYVQLYLPAQIAGSLLGSLVVFLWYNRPPATIYLGDAGALFIGGVLCVVPFLFNWHAYTWMGTLTPVIILIIPLLELTFLIIIRSYKKIPFYRASPDHFALYLMKNGWAIKSILSYTAGLSLVLTAVAFLFMVNYLSLRTMCAFLSCFLYLWIRSLAPKIRDK